MSSLQSKLFSSITFVITIASLLISVVYYLIQKNSLESTIDQKLFAIATSAQSLTPAEYHNQIDINKIISAQKKQEFKEIQKSYTRLVQQLGLQYIWSLMLLDGKIVFTTSSPVLHSKSLKSAGFLEPHSNPGQYLPTLENQQISYTSFFDEWGAGRMVMIPSVDNKNRPYLFAASISIREVQDELTAIRIRSIVLAGIVLLVGIVLGTLINQNLIKPLTGLNQVVGKVTRELGEHSTHQKSGDEIFQMASNLKTISETIQKRINTLERSNKRFHSILDSLDVAIYVVDFQSQEILYANRVMSDIFNDQNLLGKNCHQTLYNRFSECEYCNIKSIVDQRGRPSGTASRISRNSRNRKWYQHSSQAIRWTNGKLVRLESARDITAEINAQNALKKSEERLSMALEATNDGLWDWRPTSNEVHFDARFYTMLGYTPWEFPCSMQSWEELVHPDDLEEMNTALQTLLFSHTQSYKAEFRLRTKRGDWMWILSRGKVVKKNEQGTPLRIVGTHTDITVRNRLNRELQEKNLDLEQILYATSHDLRAPLVNIQGFSAEIKSSLGEIEQLLIDAKLPSELLENIQNIFSEDIDAYIRFINSSIYKMDNLLKGLLAYSRSGRVDLIEEKINMNKLMSEILETLDFKIKEQQVEVEIEELPPIYADVRQFNQLFTNLLDNAVKYLDKERQGKISVKGSFIGNEIIYCVQDNGIGISKNNIERIFQIFQRFSPAHADGVGIGTTIVRKIVQRHEGRIWIESELNKGSSFFLAFPKKNFS